MPRGRVRKAFVGTLLVSLLAALLLLSGCGSRRFGGEVPEPTSIPERTVKVSVFFSTGRSISREARIVDAEDVYAATFAEVIEARPENEKAPVVQPTAPVRSVTFQNGLVTVDWDRAVLDFEAQPEEYEFAWAAMVLTFGQFPEVERLAFTVEGKTDGEIDGKDVSKFWGAVTLADSPWDIARPPGFETESAESSATTTP